MKELLTKIAKDRMQCSDITILVVDDEKHVASLIGQMLEKMGYKIKVVINPVEALELFRSKPDAFDLIITDMMMPQMSGAKLSQNLKETRPDIPIILCTGYSSLVDENKAKQIGLAAYLIKPVSMFELANTLHTIFDKQ